MSLTRRDLSTRLLSFLSIVTAFHASPASGEESAAGNSGISRTCECIHQEVAFTATPSRIYTALTDAKQFARVTEFSMPGAAASTVISPHVGGEFSIFKGIIVGRHIEMVRNLRLVQAWREKDWDTGLYSVVRFQLHPNGSGTRLAFDHTG